MFSPLIILVYGVSTLIGLVSSFPTSPPISYPRSAYSETRELDLSRRVDRPQSVDGNAFHTSQFEQFDSIGFVAGSPGVEAAPVYLFSRTEPIFNPCYPESAITIGSNPLRPNPGTAPPAGIDPGEDCTHPGDYHGDHTLASTRFPVYVSVAHCDDEKNGNRWLVNYATYYVHDKIMLEGHRHDWESITVAFKQEPKNSDWWHRDSAIYSKHGLHDVIGWGELISVDVDTGLQTDVRDETRGSYKKHPKAYIGFFSHAHFPFKCDQPECPKTFSAAWDGSPLQNNEYRSSDWWRLPRAEDLRPGSDISSGWSYGDAKSTPSENKKNMCGWSIGRDWNDPVS